MNCSYEALVQESALAISRSSICIIFTCSIIIIRTYFFEKKNLEFFGVFFLYIPLEVPDKQKQSSTLGNSAKLCYIPHKFQGQRPRPLEIPHEFFLLNPGNSTSFLINTRKFCILFPWYPWKFHILKPPHLLFGFFLE